MVKFTNNYLATHVPTNLNTEDWVLLRIYLGKRITRMRIRRIPSEIKVECLETVVWANTSENIAIVQTARTQN